VIRPLRSKRYTLEATRQKSISDKPAGKSTEAAGDAGSQARTMTSPEGTGSNLDLQA